MRKKKPNHDQLVTNRRMAELSGVHEVSISNWKTTRPVLWRAIYEYAVREEKRRYEEEVKRLGAEMDVALPAHMQKDDK